MTSHMGFLCALQAAPRATRAFYGVVQPIPRPQHVILGMKIRLAKTAKTLFEGR